MSQKYQANDYPSLAHIIVSVNSLFYRGLSACGWLDGEIHVASGLSLAMLLLLRVGLRWHYRNQLPAHKLTRWQHIAAHSVQMLLYLCLLLTPIAGYFTLTADADDFMLFGMNLPYFSLEISLGKAHVILANSFIALSGVHALAALFHHVVLKDNVLKSMSPH